MRLNFAHTFGENEVTFPTQHRVGYMSMPIGMAALTRVCSARDPTADMMRLQGYCYGREGDSVADHEWHACTSISYGNDYFKQ